MRVKDQNCTVPDCARKAKILSEGRPVCNMHWQRWYANGTFEGRGPSPDYCKCVCAECGKDFIRHYRMNATRKRKKQFCSQKCVSVDAKKKAAERLEKRFWSKVKIAGPDDCWEWQAQLSKPGYGCFMYKRGETQLAHRISFMLARGVLPPPKVLVCHSCDNPKCVNPNHLWLGDVKANYDDMVQKGRRVFAKVRGERVASSKLTEEQAREILDSTLTNKQLAQKFYVSASAVRLIRIGRNWSYLQEAS